MTHFACGWGGTWRGPLSSPGRDAGHRQPRGVVRAPARVCSTLWGRESSDVGHLCRQGRRLIRNSNGQPGTTPAPLCSCALVRAFDPAHSGRERLLFGIPKGIPGGARRVAVDVLQLVWRKNPQRLCADETQTSALPAESRRGGRRGHRSSGARAGQPCCETQTTRSRRTPLRANVSLSCSRWEQMGCWPTCHGCCQRAELHGNELPAEPVAAGVSTPQVVACSVLETPRRGCGRQNRRPAAGCDVGG